MNLEAEFKKNLFFNTEQLCQLQDEEWDTLKTFVPTSLVGSMYGLLKKKQMKLNETEGANNDTKSVASGYTRQTGYRRSQRNPDSVSDFTSQRRSVKNEERVIVLHWEGKQHLVKLFDGISRQDLNDYVHEILDIENNVKLKYDDFEGNNVLLCGSILNGTHINVTKFKSHQSFINSQNESKFDHTL